LVDYAGDTVPLIIDLFTDRFRPAQIVVAVMSASNVPVQSNGMNRKPGHG
jgi:transposase